MNFNEARWANANIVVKVVVAVIAIVVLASLWELAAENIGFMSDLALPDWARQYLTFQGWWDMISGLFGSVAAPVGGGGSRRHAPARAPVGGGGPRRHAPAPAPAPAARRSGGEPRPL